MFEWKRPHLVQGWQAVEHLSAAPALPRLHSTFLVHYGCATDARQSVSKLPSSVFRLHLYSLCTHLKCISGTKGLNQTRLPRSCDFQILHRSSVAGLFFSAPLEPLRKDGVSCLQRSQTRARAAAKCARHPPACGVYHACSTGQGTLSLRAHNSCLMACVC